MPDVEYWDFVLWEDEVIFAELESGRCPWIFGAGDVTA